MKSPFTKFTSLSVRPTAQATKSAIEALESRIAPAKLFAAVDSNTLISFDSATPGTLDAPIAITGLGAGEDIVGIDFRPATGALYALTQGAGDVGRLYTIDIVTGAATFASVLAPDPADLTNPYTSLSGAQFGVDFNPVPDRLRVVSDTLQNLRINVATGLVTTDGTINGPASPTSSAYANSFAGATTTTLYGIDVSNDTLNIQNPPNNGTQVLVGALGVNAGTTSGFDILATGDKAAPQLTAFAALSVGGVNGLYSINLANGAATAIGTIGTGTNVVDGFAIQPEPQNLTNAATAYAVDVAGNLLRFNSQTPGTISSTTAITGLQSGDSIVGVDFRPANGVLYAITNNAGAAKLYTINPTTAAATLLGALTADPADTTSPFTTLAGTGFGVDFNPVADRLRVVSDGDQNLRINVDTLLVTTDATLNPGDPNVIASAYTNSFAGSTSTTLYGIDSATDQLFLQNPPNNGTLVAVGSGLGVDASAVLNFDIRAGLNTAFATLVVGGTPGLYSINLTTGAATSLGAIGGAPTLAGFALAPSGVLQFSAPSFSGTEAGGTVTITVERVGGSDGAVSALVSTSDLSAIAPGDYTALINSLVSFADGNSTAQTVSIPIANDVTAEDLEHLRVTLSGATGGAVLGRSSATVTIADNEVLPANAFAVDANNNLLRFNTAAPGTIISTTPITGIVGEVIEGIDFRPANGKLYVLTNNAGAGQLYTIDVATGLATAGATLTADPTDLTTPYTGLSGASFAVDFNPTVDRLRVVGDSNQNLRINVDTGFVITDADAQPGDPNIVGAAYANSFAGATTTTLFTIDSTADSLSTQIPANNGTQVLVGNLNVDITATAGFDIRTLGGVNLGLAALTSGTTSSLYSIDLTTGAATLVGAIGTGGAIRAFAVAPTAFSSSLSGSSAVLTGTAAGDEIVIDQVNGLLRHNRFAAGDSGFNSEIDFDSATPGDQTLAAAATSTVTVFGAGGADQISIGGTALLPLNGTSLVVDGGAGADRIVINANGGAGLIALNPGTDSDTIDFSTSTSGVLFDLDAVGAEQVVNNSNLRIVLSNPVENLVGSTSPDLIYVDASPLPRTIDGNSLSGDRLVVDGQLEYAQVTRTGQASGSVSVPGFALVSYDDISSLRVDNSSASSVNANTFSAPITTDTGKKPVAVAVGDLNGDGLADIVTANAGSNNLSVLLSNGDGSFTASTVSAGGKGTADVVLGNVDGDSDLDLVVSNTKSNQVAVFTNDGAGTFAIAGTYAAGKAPTALALGNLDADGDLDIAVVNAKGNKFSVLTNDGTGTYGSLFSAATGGKKPTDIAIADLDEDDAMDIVTVNSGSANISVVYGLGTTNVFSSPELFATQNKPTSLVVADLDHDQHLDLAVNDATGRFIGVLLGNGSAGSQFDPIRKIAAAQKSSATALAIGDLNGDGFADLVTAQAPGEQARISLGLGHGVFRSPISLPFAPDAASSKPIKSSASAVAVGDFDGDGILDIVVADSGAASINVLLRTPIA